MVPRGFGYYRSAGGVTGTPWGKYGPYWAARGERGPRQEVAPPPLGSPNWIRRWGAAPLSLSLSLSFLPPSSLLVGLGKGSPTPTRRRTPPPLARLSRP